MREKIAKIISIIIILIIAILLIRVFDSEIKTVTESAESFLTVCVISIVLLNQLVDLYKYLVSVLLKIIYFFTKPRVSKDSFKLKKIPQEFNEIYNKIYDNKKEMKKLKQTTLLMYYIAIIFLVGIIGSYFFKNINIISFIILYMIFLVILKTTKKTIIIRAIILMFLFTALIDCNFISSDFIVICLILPAIFAFINQKFKFYVDKYKKETLMELVSLINKDLVYTPEEPISSKLKYNMFKDKYYDSKFEINKTIDFKSEDYIEGYVNNNVFLRMAEIDVDEVIRNGNDFQNEKLFHGIFAFTEFVKNINTEIIITKNKPNSYNSNMKIEMDSNEFENLFNVYSKNKLVAMRVLTSDVMQLLIDFYREYNVEFEIIIENNNVYLRFLTEKIFEPSMKFGDFYEKKSLLLYYSIIKFVSNISLEINQSLDEFIE